jgi:hypothetical protein
LHWEICCLREQGANEVLNNLKDIQHVTKFASGLEDFVKRLQQSIICNSSNTQSQSCGVWGMGVTGKALLSQMPAMVMKCANIWKELWWFSSWWAKTPKITRLLYDSLFVHSITKRFQRSGCSCSKWCLGRESFVTMASWVGHFSGSLKL